MYGQQIYEVIENHHEAFGAFFKKPTIYYQLDRLVEEGLLEKRNEAINAPGRGNAHQDMSLREREVYYITEEGRQRFMDLLSKALQAYEPGPRVIDTAIFFLNQIPPQEVVSHLCVRLERLVQVRVQLMEQMKNKREQDRAHIIVNDHAVSMLDAEIGWLERTIERISSARGATHEGERL